MENDRFNYENASNREKIMKALSFHILFPFYMISTFVIDNITHFSNSLINHNLLTDNNILIDVPLSDYNRLIEIYTDNILSYMFAEWVIIFIISFCMFSILKFERRYKLYPLIFLILSAGTFVIISLHYSIYKITVTNIFTITFGRIFIFFIIPFYVVKMRDITEGIIALIDMQNIESMLNRFIVYIYEDERRILADIYHEEHERRYEENILMNNPYAFILGGHRGALRAFRERGPPEHPFAGIEKPKEIPIMKQKVTDCTDDLQCSICFDNIINGTEICDIPCKHIFHYNCISEWDKKSAYKVCPLCRGSLRYRLKAAT